MNSTAARRSRSPPETGACALVPRLLPADLCARWRAVAERHPTSVRCRDVPGLDLAIAWSDLARAGVFDRYRSVLGERPACDLDECWVRRQFPLGHEMAGRGPHSWHQDGALKFDFGGHAGTPSRQGSLLGMLTCWIALTPCGIDAPGLELVRGERLGLLTPDELNSESVARRFAADAFWRPAMAPGDTLLFEGDVLHRTYVDPTMRSGRSSVELRFFNGDRLPERLAGDRCAAVAASA